MPLRNARFPTRNVESRSRTSSRAASNSASARTDGGNHEDGLALRRRGLGSSTSMLGGLKAAYFKAKPERFVTPKQIADEIRRLRGHDSSTVYERHARFHEGDHSYPHHVELVSLCAKLFSLSYEAHTGHFAAQCELFALSVEDPVVFELSRICEPSPGHLSYDFFDMRKGGGDCQRRWSELLGRNTFKSNQRSETAQYSCDALKETFNVFGRMAIEYVPYAMALRMQDDDIVLLHQLWDNFLDVVSRFDCHRNVDLCFRNIISSGKPLSYFASSSQLKRIALFLILHSASMPFVLSTFFPSPKLDSQGPKDPYGAKLVIRSPASNWDIVTASTYAIPFLGAYVKEKSTSLFPSREGDVFHTLSELIEGKYGIGTPLERTVFAKEESAFIELYKTVYDAVISYRRVKGVRSKLEENVCDALVALVDPSLITIVTGKPSWKGKKDWDVPRSNFIIAHTVDIDRYHKLEMLDNFKENDAYINALNDRLRFQTFLRDPDGICSLTYIPQFWNVSYLRRFQIDSKYFITADDLPESKDQILNLWSRGDFPGVTVIDTMALNGEVLTCLRVDRESSVFYCGGHYPIFAGFEFETKEPLYVAVVHQKVDSPWYFTTVKDGASSAKYTDEVGEEHEAENFFVLALRHDPIDIPPQDIQHRAGAKDPSGPVYWMEFWPRKDAHYPTDERLRDDRHLESLLGDLRERKIMDSILEGFD